MERAVQGTISFLRATKLQHGTAGGWSNLVKDEAFWANSKFQKYMDTPPPNSCLDFTLSRCIMTFERLDMTLTTRIPKTFKKPPGILSKYLWLVRDENRCLSADALAYIYY